MGKVEDRFWNKVGKQSDSDCWLWKGSVVGNSGYGKFWDGARTVGAHRFSYEMHNASVPEGMVVCHTCDNKLCVNPAHLWAGTQMDNIRDRDSKGRCRSGQYPTNKGTKGEKHPMHKLTWEQVREIRGLYRNSSYSFTELGRRFFISNVQVSNICFYKQWKDDPLNKQESLTVSS